MIAKRARQFENLNSIKNVPADAGWETVRKVTGFGDTVLRPDSVFELVKFSWSVHFWFEDYRRGIVLRIPTAKRGGSDGEVRKFVGFTAWGVDQVCAGDGGNNAGARPAASQTRSRRNLSRGGFGSGFRLAGGISNSFGFVLAD